MGSPATTDRHPGTPGLLRLPIELLSRILLDVLSSGRITWIPRYSTPIWGLPLHKRGLPQFESDSESAVWKNPGYAPINGLLFASKQLHHECLTLLAEKATFIIHVDVRDVAPTGANAFQEIAALDAAFRNSVRGPVVISLSFLSPAPDGHFVWQKFTEMMNQDRNPLMFEKIVENINELLHLMPGVEKMHLVWNMFFGNSGLAMLKERYTRQLWERLRKEWPGRNIKWSAQHCMGSFEYDSKSPA